MKKVIIKTVIGLSLLGAGVVAITAIAPSAVVYAIDLVDVEDGLDWNLLDQAISKYDGLSQKRKDYVNQQFLNTGLSSIETMRNHYAGEQFRDDINQQDFINDDANILNNFINLAIQNVSDDSSNSTPTPAPEVPNDQAKADAEKAAADAQAKADAEKATAESKTPATTSTQTAAPAPAASEKSPVRQTGVTTGFPIISALVGTIGLVGISLRKKFFA